MLLENLEIHGAGFVGGNAITRRRFFDLRGTFLRRVIDCGFISAFNDFVTWRPRRLEPTSDNGPMFQCSESCADNWFHNIVVTDVSVPGLVSTYSELCETFVDKPGSTTGEKIRQPLATASDLPVKDGVSGAPTVALVSWQATDQVQAFADLAKPGAKVYDADGKIVYLTFAVMMRYTTPIGNYRDKMYRHQLDLWQQPATLPKLRRASGQTFDITELITMGPDWAIFSYRIDSTSPQTAPNGTCTCDLFPGVDFTTESALIDDDVDNQVKGNRTGNNRTIGDVTTIATITMPV